LLHTFALGVRLKDLPVANLLPLTLPPSGHVFDTIRERTVKTGGGKFTAFILIVLQQVFPRQIHKRPPGLSLASLE
jgi:hypothetical protein